MRPLLIALVAGLALAVAAPAFAESDTFAGTASLDHKGQDAQGRQIISGSINSPGFGKGVLTLRVTPKADGSLNGVFTMKFKFGSMSGTTKAQLTPDPSVGNKLNGSGKITGGTRAYKDGKGSFTMKGDDRTDGTVTVAVKGKVKFPTR
jgi:hypothetical protein